MAKTTERFKGDEWERLIDDVRVSFYIRKFACGYEAKVGKRTIKGSEGHSGTDRGRVEDQFRAEILNRIRGVAHKKK